MADEYIEEVVRKGDLGSDLLAEICARTFDNSPYANKRTFQPVLWLPEGFDVVVFQAAGDPKLEGRDHACSLVEILAARSRLIGASPVGFANVIDSRTGDLSLLEELGMGMRDAADRHNLVILNGENAILGDRIRSANMVGTMVAIVKNGKAG